MEPTKVKEADPEGGRFDGRKAADTTMTATSEETATVSVSGLDCATWQVRLSD